MQINLDFLKQRVFQFNGIQITVGILLVALALFLVWRAATKR
jgi:hypothetical protein